MTTEEQVAALQAEVAALRKDVLSLARAVVDLAKATNGAAEQFKPYIPMLKAASEKFYDPATGKIKMPGLGSIFGG